MNILKKIGKFLRTWNELLTIPLALTLWYFSPSLLRWVDPTAATYDYGVFQVILFAIIQFFIFTGVVWVYLKITFPKLYKYLDDNVGTEMEKDELTKWQKTKTVLSVFGMLLFAIVLLSRVV
jgi:hypothetical protein